jgi:hypothetical protein
MTETEWLTATDPTPLLVFLGSRGGERKLRLFAAGCCRSVWRLLTDERSQSVVIATERYAEQLATAEELDQACEQAGEVCGVANAWDAAQAVGSRYFAGAFESVTDAAAFAACWTGMRVDRLDVAFVANAVTFASQAGTRRETVSFLHDIFGNPFRPVTADPPWLTSTVVALAAQMYESRDFSAMHILADALQDAGCDNLNILNHARGPGPHVRGCWVVDLILGKS